MNAGAGAQTLSKRQVITVATFLMPLLLRQGLQELEKTRAQILHNSKAW